MTSEFPAIAVQFIGLAQNNRLVLFDSDNLRRVESVRVTGLNGTLLGIDQRPANGMIYGLTTTNNIYTIDPDTGVATLVSTLNQPFSGGNFSGLDFNPVPDRLRLVGSNDQNFRINVDTGEVSIDTAVTYAAGDANEGADPNITASAYTNAFAGSTATQLYNLDSALDSLVLQSPPNDGVLSTVGDLGFNLNRVAGFDIVSAPDGTNNGFVVSGNGLYSLDLNTGEASRLGSIGLNPGVRIQGLTTRPMIPEIAVDAKFIALTDNNMLMSFDPTNLTQVESIAVTGLSGTLLGIDQRPANGMLYGLTTTNQIYTIDPETGVATLVSTLNQPFTGGGISGLDFNPVPDRLRLVGSNNQNFRINVDTGEVSIDTAVAYATDDANEGADPNITGSAYINSFAGSTTTALYNLDSTLDSLVLQNPPNDGLLTTVGDLGIDLADLAGFDIISSPMGSNAAFAISNSTLYSLDLDSGKAYTLGAIGADPNVNIQGLAIMTDSMM
ncbi:DUF4394 domain-containing protein [Gloeocapsa sp. PCC 73106]|uniref:DUF4394 domain-containing protein n=1 Tax=Gloeocapsa sp. PCC 73106 TaxID=102232 RepID=UPI001930A22A|nr:DUF4394 domain-containing protein [Gloeocapsa sp. PCC 73106]